MPPASWHCIIAPPEPHGSINASSLERHCCASSAPGEGSEDDGGAASLFDCVLPTATSVNRLCKSASRASFTARSGSPIDGQSRLTFRAGGLGVGESGSAGVSLDSCSVPRFTSARGAFSISINSAGTSANANAAN